MWVPAFSGGPVLHDDLKPCPHQRQCRQKRRHCRQKPRHCRRNRRQRVAETGSIVFLATMLPDCCRFRRQCRLCGRDYGDNVAGFGDNVAVFGDIVAGVDGTLGGVTFDTDCFSQSARSSQRPRTVALYTANNVKAAI